MVEFWRAGGPGALNPIELARSVEADGWDGQMFMDSQCLSADPWVLMASWASATERLKLCTGVSNPLTRHNAVTAACAATLQAISGGRAVLGIGRGDSALAYLGLAPVGLSAFERALTEIQALLSGKAVAFGGTGPGADAPSLDTMSLGDRPTESRLEWLPADLPKVPLDVAATGPKVIEMSAPMRMRRAADCAMARDGRASPSGSAAPAPRSAMAPRRLGSRDPRVKSSSSAMVDPFVLGLVAVPSEVGNGGRSGRLTSPG